ncbi:MAG: hypothetical protein U0T82_00165 [Bacteroidales bacterium]
MRTDFMEFQDHSIEQLELFIAEWQKKIFVTNQLLKEETITAEETRRLTEELVSLKNQMFVFQATLRKKYTEEFKKETKSQQL